MSKILFFYSEDWEKRYFEEKIGQDFTVEFLKGRVQDYPNLEDGQAEILSVFVSSQVNAQVLEKLPNLKYVITRSTGFDHLDLEVLRKKQIRVSNVPTYGSVTVAEFAFALLLTISRKIFLAYTQILEQGNFEKEGLRGFDLNGKTLGVVGVGKIGLNLIKIANGFGMKVMAFDRHPDETLSQTENFTYSDLDNLLKQADVISLHLPYNPQTHHLLNQESFAKMKKGVVIINTSRGGIIDTGALVEALKSGRVAGAGLDVLEEEIYMGKELDLLRKDNVSEAEVDTVLHNQYLIEHPQVIITPHNAFNTQEALERIFDTTAESIKKFVAGEVVNEVK